jgi:hypothetical protein
MRISRVAAVTSLSLISLITILSACGEEDDSTDDLTPPDAAVSNDGSRADGARPLEGRDASEEASSGDSGDASTPPKGDAGADASGDSGDAGVNPCAPGFWDDDNNPNTACVEFAASLAKATCDSLSRCCFGSVLPNGGSITTGGTFDRTKCEVDYSVYGFEYALDGLSSLTGSKNVVVDPIAAQSCLMLVTALSCDASGAAITSARAACIRAVVGTRSQGQSCRRSIECGEGFFCLPDNPALPTSAGICTPLRTQGGSCNIAFTGNAALPVTDPTRYGTDYADSLLAEEACSYRAGGTTAGSGLRCTSWPGGSQYNDRVSAGQAWTCQPTLANGSGCNSSAWCSQGYCDSDDNNPNAFVCTSPHTYFPSAKCTPYALP